MPSFRTEPCGPPRGDFERSRQTQKPERALRTFRRAQPVEQIVTIGADADALSKVGGFYARGGRGSRVGAKAVCPTETLRPRVGA